MLQEGRGKKWVFSQTGYHFFRNLHNKFLDAVDRAVLEK